MKRSAAILGPTPAFVRWAIRHACPLREIDDEELPASTFRQLRSLSELDLAIREERVFQDIAFHPDTTRDGELLGFPVNEVLHVFGGVESIAPNCTTCPANTLSNVNGWAGCYGLAILKDSTFQDDTASALQSSPIDSQFRDHFELSQAGWFGIWAPRSLNSAQQQILELAMGDRSSLPADWQRLLDATRLCQVHQQELHVEYFPTGHSDGVNWTLDPHCSFCRAPRNTEHTHCPYCSNPHIQQTTRKRKVLGIRPYMKLKHILGEERSREIAGRYLNSKSDQESPT